MLRRFSFIFLSVFILAGCSGALKNQKISSIDELVKVEVDPYTWDFGDIKQGQILEHEFILKNESSVVLNLRDAASSCGCTVFALNKKVLQPQESTSIGVKFDSKGYLGPIQQFVYLNTDSIDNPVIRFIIKARVIKE